jgi:hypothetical protein
MLFATTSDLLEYLGLRSLSDLPPLKEISEVIKTGPPEGITQSDIDFFEEINLIRSKLTGDESKIDEVDLMKNMRKDLNEEDRTAAEEQPGEEQ